MYFFKCKLFIYVQQSFFLYYNKKNLFWKAISFIKISYWKQSHRQLKSDIIMVILQSIFCIYLKDIFIRALLGKHYFIRALLDLLIFIYCIDYLISGSSFINWKCKGEFFLLFILTNALYMDSKLLICYMTIIQVLYQFLSFK